MVLCGCSNLPQPSSQSPLRRTPTDAHGSRTRTITAKRRSPYPLLLTIAFLPRLVLLRGASLAWLMLLFAAFPSVCPCLSLQGSTRPASSSLSLWAT
ncbi:hypothetical protein FA13DRAFT_870851 [Coprinellus micaceus]|uniref:Uncharacterized protein n=1 Tax=Coprinellus micaceus TaxID=71717 RepID=A0A4Y7S148_COPMI|nr:hypothetical protein FA13DRAFT_870851 [Coprinellus micaceus]